MARDTGQNSPASSSHASGHRALSLSSRRCAGKWWNIRSPRTMAHRKRGPSLWLFWLACLTISSVKSLCNNSRLAVLVSVIDRFVKCTIFRCSASFSMLSPFRRFITTPPFTGSLSGFDELAERRLATDRNLLDVLRCADCANIDTFLRPGSRIQMQGPAGITGQGRFVARLRRRSPPASTPAATAPPPVRTSPIRTPPIGTGPGRHPGGRPSKPIAHRTLSAICGLANAKPFASIAAASPPNVFEPSNAAKTKTTI